jgi:hypothetical protein
MEEVPDHRILNIGMKIDYIIREQIFTLGDPDVYDPLMNDAKPHRKLGPHRLPDGEQYPGGIAFRSVDDTRAYAASHEGYGAYHVYALEGVPDRDTYQPATDHESIKRDLQIVGKVWP